MVATSMTPTTGIPATLVTLSQSTKLLVTDKRGVYFLRGREVFELSDREWERLRTLDTSPRYEDPMLRILERA